MMWITLKIDIKVPHILFPLVFCFLESDLCAQYAAAIAFLSVDDALHIYYCVDSGTFADLKVHG